MTADEIKEYYSTQYHGEVVESGDFPRLFSRAEENLQMLTGGKLYTVPAELEEYVKKALCAQIEYLHFNGVESASVGVYDGGFTTGHVSVSGVSVGKSDGLNRLAISYRAQMLLFPTGLLYRGVVLC